MCALKKAISEESKKCSFHLSFLTFLFPLISRLKFSISVGPFSVNEALALFPLPTAPVAAYIHSPWRLGHQCWSNCTGNVFQDIYIYAKRIFHNINIICKGNTLLNSCNLRRCGIGSLRCVIVLHLQCRTRLITMETFFFHFSFFFSYSLVWMHLFHFDPIAHFFLDAL